MDLAAEGKTDALEEAWIGYTEQPDADWLGLVEVVGALADQGEGEMAEVLAWTALTGAGEKAPPKALLAFASAVLRRFEKNEDLRGEVVGLYEKVYAETEGFTEVLEASGLADGSKSVRLALRRLDICLTVEPGCFLLERGGESVARVSDRAVDRSHFTIETERGSQQMPAEKLVVDYTRVDDDDFRVLTAFRPDRLTELIDSNPLALMVGLLRAHNNRIDADELKFVLCPRHIATDKWAKWWTRARTALKRSPHIKIEGRSPVFIVYEEKGHSLEDDAQEAFDKASTGPEIREAVEVYFREVQNLKATPDRPFVTRLAKELRKRVASMRRHRPAEALIAAIALQKTVAPHVEDSGEDLVTDLLETAEHPIELLCVLPDARTLLHAVEAVQTARPDDWVDVYVHWLPTAPLNAVDQMCTALLDTGHAERLQDVVAKAMERPIDAVSVCCWLWMNPARASDLGAPPHRTVLASILNVLAEVERSDSMPRERANDIKAATRNALGAARCKVFRSTIKDMEQSLAGTFRRQIGRVDGLGPALRDKLLAIVRENFPGLYKVERVLPWEDDSVIYTTAEGLAKIRAQLAEIVTVKMKENAKAIGDAAAKGDLSENSEYKFALEERDLLQARASRMSVQIDMANVLSPGNVPDDRVWIGSGVTLHADDGATHQIAILGPWDSNPDEGIYNYQTPLCQALMGREIGEEVVVDLGGQPSRCTIQKLDAAY